jgi:hypothetical protein
MSTSEPAGAATVRFGRRQSRGLLLGLSTIRVIAAGIAMIVIVAGLVAGGGIGLVASGLIWGPLLAATFVRWQGRPAIEWAPVAAHWSARNASGQTVYRARVSKPRPVGTMALPGDAAPLRFYNDPDSGMCMIHDPHRQTLSAVLRVTHPSYVLLSPDAQRSRVGAWGRVLAGLAQTGTCAALQVLESTVSDTGRGATDWWEHRGREARWATAQYEALLAQSAHGASSHRTTVTLSLDMRSASRAIRDAGRGVTGAANVLRSDATALEHSLRAAELRLDHWLAEAEIAVMVRQAYDPAVAADFDPRSAGANLTHAGPTAVNEQWAYLRHDSGFSTVLWISEWPRIDVPPHFLHAVVFAPGVRKSLSIIARPLQTTAALRQIRKEKTEMITDSHQKAKIGQLADLSDDQEYEDVLSRERALISGHADIAFSGLLAVTASTEDELAAAVSQIQRAANQAACETRVLYGQQAQAFVAAALPFARGVQ